MVGIYSLTPARKVLHYLSTTVKVRSFASAAALKIDFEYDSDYESYLDRVRLEPKAQSLFSMGGRGVQWVFIGNPTVQKHIYAEKISRLLEVPHISMGSLVRQELNPLSSLYKQIANALNEGKLVPEDIVFGLLSKRLEEGYHRGETGFILEGLPRTRIQAEILDQIASVDLVVNFQCIEECMRKKQLESASCPYCEQQSHTSCSESLSIHKCSMTRTCHVPVDVDGARKEKLRIYEEQSKPLEDYYRKQRKILDFQVAGGPGETWRGLLAALHLQHMDTVVSSPKLMA